MELPGNKGRPDANSAKMQPADQRSIDVEYCLEPINTSGALYHNVTTYNTTQYIVQSRSNCLVNKPHGNNFERGFQMREQDQNHQVLSLLSAKDHTFRKRNSRFQHKYEHRCAIPY
jgi:hypothetical protein